MRQFSLNGLKAFGNSRQFSPLVFQLCLVVRQPFLDVLIVLLGNCQISFPASGLILALLNLPGQLVQILGVNHGLQGVALAFFCL